MNKVAIMIGNNTSVENAINHFRIQGFSDNQIVIVDSVKHDFSKCTIETKVVIFKDFRENHNLEIILFDYNNDLIVDLQSKEPFVINPKIAIVVDSNINIEDIKNSGSSILRRIEFIEFNNESLK